MTGGARVAVLVRGDDAGREAVEDARDPVFIDVTQGLAELHLALAASGPFDRIVDRSGPKAAVKRFNICLYHCTAGGAYVVGSASSPASPEQVSELLLHVRTLQERRAAGAEPPRPGRDDRTNPERDLDALACSVGDVRFEGGVLEIENTASTLAKIPEDSMNRLLTLRPGLGSVLATRPGVSFASRCLPRLSDDRFHEVFPRVYEAPELSLRTYSDVVCMPRQAAFRDNLVLPESFRHIARRRLRNQQFPEWAPRFLGRPDVVAEPLDGAFYYLDNHVRGHFGHALTEQISHLWGWAEAKRRIPDLRALVFAYGDKGVADWELDLLAAGGVERSDVVVADGPRSVRTLVTTTPMFSMPEFIHPGIVETYDSIGERFAASPARSTWPDRIFCSRRIRKRWCHNTSEVEELFARAGFEVVYPEEHPLAEQVQLVRNAQVVAGFAGSGMFQVAFAGAPKTVILVSSESYTAQNEYMMSAVLGHDLAIAYCRPDLSPTTGRFSAAVYQSDFTFDREREGVFLERVLSDL